MLPFPHFLKTFNFLKAKDHKPILFFSSQKNFAGILFLYLLSLSGEPARKPTSRQLSLLIATELLKIIGHFYHTPYCVQ